MSLFTEATGTLTITDLVLSRKRNRYFNEDQAVTVRQTADQTIKIQRVIDPDSGEVELYCHSKAREQKEQAMQDRFSERCEQQLTRLAEGLHQKGRGKGYGKVMLRLGRLNEKCARVVQHYHVEVRKDANSDRISAHLFISMLAYHLVHTLRIQLKAKGIHSSWEQIRQILSTLVRCTADDSVKDNKGSLVVP